MLNELRLIAWPVSPRMEVILPHTNSVRQYPPPTPAECHPPPHLAGNHSDAKEGLGNGGDGVADLQMLPASCVHPVSPLCFATQGKFWVIWREGVTPAAGGLISLNSQKVDPPPPSTVPPQNITFGSKLIHRNTVNFVVTRAIYTWLK